MSLSELFMPEKLDRQLWVASFFVLIQYWGSEMGALGLDYRLPGTMHHTAKWSAGWDLNKSCLSSLTWHASKTEADSHKLIPADLVYKWQPANGLLHPLEQQASLSEPLIKQDALCTISILKTYN